MSHNLYDQHLPAVFQVADSASKKAQGLFINMMRWNLIMLTSSSILGIYSFEDSLYKRWIAIVAVVLLIISTTITLMVDGYKWEDVWYEGRAVAESAKTLAWRYATCAEPFLVNISVSIVDEELRKDLISLMKNKKGLTDFISNENTSSLFISNEMRLVRALSFQDRLALYLTDRVLPQKSWYSQKAVFNQRKRNTWFRIIIIAQVAAVVTGVLLAAFPDWKMNLTGLFTAIASAGIAWLQIRRHQELNRAYAITAIELELVYDKSREVKSENDLAIYVADAETAISREHTLWLARRDIF